MESLTETTSFVSTLVASAAMVVLGLRKHVLVQRRALCRVCGRESRACRCRRG